MPWGLPVANNVAETILQQLGGRRFVAMTGARQFLGGKNSLSFKLPGKNFCKGDINYVRIELTPMDVYDMVFCRIRGTNVTEIAKHEGIYNDQLRGIFTQETGLRTSL